MGSLEMLRPVWEEEEEQCLQKLREAVNGNRNLDAFSWLLTDRFLLHFVRGKKYNEAKAYSTLKNYFYIRQKQYPKFFKNFRPSNTLAFEKGTTRILKHRDVHNRRVAITRFGAWDPNELPAEDLIKGGMLLVEEVWNYEDTEHDGVILIIDMQNYSLAHLRAFGPSQIKKVIHLLWSNYPVKYKGIHLVNMVYLATVLFKTVQPFLPKKFKERMHLHGHEYCSLHEHISPEVLPQSLGGELTEDQAFDPEYERCIEMKEDFYRCFAQCIK